MTADVNVTEKMAGAIYDAAFGQWLPESPVHFAEAALTALSDPEVLAGMGEVLAGHVLDEYVNTCACGEWEHFEDDYDERVATYTAHVATTLADWLRGQR